MNPRWKQPLQIPLQKPLWPYYRVSLKRNRYIFWATWPGSRRPMQSAKKQPGLVKTGPGKGRNYEYLYKKADMYRLVRDCAEQLPFPVPLPKTGGHISEPRLRRINTCGGETGPHTVFCLPHGDFGRDDPAGGSL